MDGQTIIRLSQILLNKIFAIIYFLTVCVYKHKQFSELLKAAVNHRSAVIG